MGMLDWYIPILKGNLMKESFEASCYVPAGIGPAMPQGIGSGCKNGYEPFLGSGTTLAACLEMGVNAVGFELSENFVSRQQHLLG